MEIFDKIVRFSTNTLGPNIPRYLLIIFLLFLAFIAFVLVNLVLRGIFDPIANRMTKKRIATSRVYRFFAVLISVVLVAFLLYWLYGVVPVLNPLNHMRI